MRKGILRLTSMIAVILVLVGVFCTGTLANVADDLRAQQVTNITQNYGNEILGSSDSSSEIREIQTNKGEEKILGNTLPNYVILNWVATEDSIIFDITNLGIDSVDLVYGTIDTGNMKKSFQFSNVGIGKNKYTISGVPLLTCEERIKITWYAKDGGETFGSATSTGSRQIPQSLLNLWGPGSFGSRAECLNYHFKTHGKEVAASNICEYVRKADEFRKRVIELKLTPQKLVDGKTPNVYRFRYNGYYLDAVCVNLVPTGDLISFGK